MNSLLSQIERVPVSALGYYPGNPRVGNVPVIASSLTENAQFAPIVVQRSTGYVLAGNHTLKAAQLLGWPTIDVVYVDVDDARARKIVLASNRTAERGTYDGDALVELLSYLDGDYAGTGWTEEDVTALLAPDPEDEPATGHGDPDRTPDVPEKAVSAPGDVWVLGRHRLLCGDATNPEHLALVLEGQTPGIVYTDPPYGISIVKSTGNVGGYDPASGGRYREGFGVVANAKYLPVAGDGGTEAAADSFRLLMTEFPNARHVWWGGNHYAASAGLSDSSCWLVWDKENGGNDFADAELAWTNHPGAVRLLRHMWNGMLRATERGKRVHPTQKPVALAEWTFGVVDPKAERTLVLDVFAGSGSTLIAADRTGRAAAVIEMEPHYVDVICRRWQEFTGGKPILAATGEPVDFLVQTS